MFKPGNSGELLTVLKQSQTRQSLSQNSIRKFMSPYKITGKIFRPSGSPYTQIIIIISPYLFYKKGYSIKIIWPSKNSVTDFEPDFSLLKTRIM